MNDDNLMHSVIKQPEQWSFEEWFSHFEVLFYFLCSEEWGEVRDLTGMDTPDIIGKIEALIIAMLASDKEFASIQGREFPDELRRRRDILLHSIKGFSGYRDTIKVDHIVAFKAPGVAQ